jgi:hypothetical protein
MDTELRTCKIMMTFIMIYILPAMLYESYNRHDILWATIISAFYTMYWYLKCRLITFIGCMYDPFDVTTYKL